MEINGGICELPATLRGRHDQWLTAIRTLEKGSDQLTILLIEGLLGSGKSRFLQEVAKAAAVRGFSFVPQADRARPVSAKWWRDSSAFSAAVHALLRAGPVPGPVMLAADDIHAAHLELVRELCCVIRYRESSPVILALSRRDTLSPVPEFERYLASAPNVVRVRLEPLGECHTAEVATDILGVPPGPALLSVLSSAGGNPLLLTELLHGLREEGQLVYVDGTSMLLSPMLPSRVQRLVAGIVREFTPPTQEVLRLAAAMGMRFDLYQLAELRDETVSNLLPAIDELLTAGVLMPVDDLMAFRYPLVRKALMATMPAPVVDALRRQAEDLSNGDPRPRDGRERDGDSRLAALTENERAIAELAAAGLTNLQIARRVNKSSHTVNFHLRQVFRKLGIRSRVELARMS